MTTPNRTTLVHMTAALDLQARAASELEAEGGRVHAIHAWGVVVADARRLARLAQEHVDALDARKRGRKR